MMNDRIRVLQICHSYGPPFEAVADAYASWFPPDRFDLTTVFLKGEKKPLMANLERGTNEFYGLESRDLRGLKLGLVRRLRRTMREHQYSIIIAHRNKSIYLMCGAAARRDGATLIGVVHAFGVFAPLSRRFLAWRNRDRLNLVGVSEAVREDVLLTTAPLGLSDVYAVPNCLDLHTFVSELETRDDARKFLGLGPDEYLVGTAGRLHPGKDHATLIQAFGVARGRLPAGASLAILGAGGYEDELRRQVRKLELDRHVAFLGHVESAARYFPAFDQFVLPSGVESFGLVLIEAMAAGVPVAAAASRGAQEVVGDESLLFPVADVSACADALLACAGRSAEEKDAVRRSDAARIEERFSTRAVGASFWSLPFLQSHRTSDPT